MSIEALAMAGMDYRESGIKLEEREKSGLEQPPLHLVAEQNSCVEDEKMGGGDVIFEANGEWTKARMREWAKAVAALMDREV
jgi:hypothetical protein